MVLIIEGWGLFEELTLKGVIIVSDEAHGQRLSSLATTIHITAIQGPRLTNSHRLLHLCELCLIHNCGSVLAGMLKGSM